MRIHPAFVVLGACALSLLAPAAGAQRNPASSLTVRGDIRPSGSGNESLLYVINHSDETIIVQVVRLMECKGVWGSCFDKRINTRIFPGGEALVYRVRQRQPDEEFSFRWTFEYKTDRQADEQPAKSAADDQPRQPVALTVDQIDSVPNPALRAKLKEALKADSLAPPVVDTLEVTPGQILLRVGQVLEPGRVLTIHAKDAQGTSIPGARARLRIEVGGEFARLDKDGLRGIKPGTAVLLVAPQQDAGTTGEPKGASRILIRVVP